MSNYSNIIILLVIILIVLFIYQNQSSTAANNSSNLDVPLFVNPIAVNPFGYGMVPVHYHHHHKSNHTQLQPKPHKQQNKKHSKQNGGTNFLGCYKNYKSGEKITEFVNNSPELCSSTCRDEGYKYFALKGSECICDSQKKGVTPQFGEKVDDKQCEQPCPSNSSLKCGGLDNYSLYDTGIDGEFGNTKKNGVKTTEEGEIGDYYSTEYITYSVPPFTKTCNCVKPEFIQNNPNQDISSNYMGCYLETQDKYLTDKAYPEGHPQLTPQHCQTVCRNMGFKFSGTKQGNECWCGNDNLGEIRPDYECNHPCSGDADQYCGGILRQSIYKVKS